MSRKPNVLQAALRQTAGRTQPKPEPVPERHQEQGGNGGQRPPSREGKVNVSAWLEPGYKRSLRMVQAVTDKKLDLLMSEALNDLFAKYNVPQIRDD